MGRTVLPDADPAVGGDDLDVQPGVGDREPDLLPAPAGREDPERGGEGDLARGCEKQYRPAEQKQYLEIAGFFASLARKEKAEGDLASIVSENLSGVYNDAEASASAAGDRGALRARLWSYKVEMIARTILSRYEKEGEKMLENSSVWVCSVCGFVFIGKSAPALCPVCKVPSWKFDKVE